MKGIDERDFFPGNVDQVRGSFTWYSDQGVGLEISRIQIQSAVPLPLGIPSSNIKLLLYVRPDLFILYEPGYNRCNLL